MLTKIIVYLKRNLKRFFGGGQIAETILFVWNHRCVLVWAMVWLAMGPLADCLCPLLRDYNYFGFILMHYHVVRKWNKLRVSSWLSLWPLWVSLSFFPPFLLCSWRLEKRICIKFFGFSGVDPQFDAPHSLFNSSTLFTILEQSIAVHAICHIFQRPQEKSLREKKCKLAPLKKIGAKNSMTLSAGELTPFGIRNVMCSKKVSPFFHVSWQVLLISLS